MKLHEAQDFYGEKFYPEPEEDFNPYDVEQPETCYLCGELIDIGGVIYFGGETFCKDCFNGDMSEEEILKTINKYKKQNQWKTKF